MYDDEKEVLCGASCYSKLFYMNEKFDNLPKNVVDELKVMCVLHTEEVGGTIQLVFGDDDCLEIRTDCNEGDLLYDEIGSGLKVHQLQIDKRELFEALEMYYKVYKEKKAMEQAGSAE